MNDPDVPPTGKESLPWWEPVIGDLGRQLVTEVLDKNYPNDGEYTQKFAGDIARVCDCRYGVGVTNGTSALALSLMALGVGRDDEVIVPDVTFIATANAVVLAGGTPVLADVSRTSGLLDRQGVEAVLTSRTKALVPVHISGRAAPMADLLDLAAQRGLGVVEDAAEALGSGTPAGRLGSFGDTGCFSFSPAKTITTGQGGVVVTNDSSLYRRLLELKDQGRPQRGTGGADHHPTLGFNFKLTNLQAAIGIGQLEELEDRLEHQRALWGWYEKHLLKDERIRLLPFDLQGGEVPQWIEVRVEGRDSLRSYLRGAGLGCRRLWRPLHTQPPYRRNDDEFPNSTATSSQGLWLPSGLNMGESDVRRVCAALTEWLQTN